MTDKQVKQPNGNNGGGKIVPMQQPQVISFLQSSQKYMKTYQNVHRQKFFQKYCSCELLKNNGNTLYNTSQWEKAIESYLQACAIFAYEPIAKQQPSVVYLEVEDGKPYDQKTLYRKIKLSLFLNLSQCYLCVREWSMAYDAATQALALEPKNEKAL